MSGPGERGQRDEGVHHSQVSQKLLRRADEGNEEDKISMGVSEGCFAFVWLLLISQKFITAWELSLLASSVCCAAIKCILIVTNLHLHSSNPGCRWFGGQKHTEVFVSTPEAAGQTHKRAQWIIPKWSSQCVFHTSWRLAWGKQLLIASSSQRPVWDHLSSLLCSSLEVSLLTAWFSLNYLLYLICFLDHCAVS